jgi:hypothetical protein
MLKETVKRECGSIKKAQSKILYLSLIYSKNRQCRRILGAKI